MGKMWRDKLPVEKVVYNDAFSLTLFPSLSWKRVSMGLTDKRKTAKNLVDRRKNWKILTVSRKYSKKQLTVKETVS